MQLTPENLDWALDRLAVFAERRGYPKSEVTLQAHGRAFLRIVHNANIVDILRKFKPKFPEDADDKAWLEENFPGNPNDADWLIDKALDRYDYAPMPVEFRRIYQPLLPPWDGQQIIEER